MHTHLLPMQAMAGKWFVPAISPGTNHLPAVFCKFITRYTGIRSGSLLEVLKSQVSKKMRSKILFEARTAAEWSGVAGIFGCHSQQAGQMHAHLAGLLAA